MIFNCIDVERDTVTPKIHPTQKSVPLLKQLIQIFTDEGDVVIDPVAGSGTTLLAAVELKRKAFGFEIKKDYYKQASELLNKYKTRKDEIDTLGYSKTELSKNYPILF